MPVKAAQAVFQRPAGVRATRAGALQVRDSLIFIGLCMAAVILLCAAMAYLAVHWAWPALAPVRSWERMRVWSRFSLLAAQEVRSWR
jgi:hypothetical protein